MPSTDIDSADSSGIVFNAVVSEMALLKPTLGASAVTADTFLLK